MENRPSLIFTTLIVLSLSCPCFADYYSTQDFSPEEEQGSFSENDSFYTDNSNDNVYPDDNADLNHNAESARARVHNSKHHTDDQEDDSINVAHTSKIPQTITGYGERTIIVNPHTHRWAAYSAEGKFIHGGLATAGSNWCRDLGHPCRTRPGTYRINSLGSRNCVSSRFPLGKGGAPMPYCMFFNGNQALHGSHELAEANLSHGCVRISVEDAEWIRFNFAKIGTKVVIKEY